MCVCVWCKSRFFGKSNIFNYVSTCQTCSNRFWIMNAICTFVYLFVVYFSFAPVISASIYCSVNYFDIQVLMMVTETETLTSTLHHNIFTYLDYVFSATFIHIYIYIYIRIYVSTWPLGQKQGVRQGHFFSEVEMIWILNFSFLSPIIMQQWNNVVDSTVTHREGKDCWLHTFPSFGI